MHGIAALDNPLYHKTPAWHRLGKVFDGHKTAAEALAESGAGFRVAVEPTYTQAGLPVDGAFATVRTDLAESDPRRILGSVGARYTPIQNDEIFRFADDLHAAGGAEIEACGTLWNGRKTWMLCRRAGEHADVNGDRVAQYMLVASAHDGTQSLVIRPTSVRVVCQNTLTLALNDGTDSEIRIRHTASAGRRIDDARTAIRVSEYVFEKALETYRKLASARVSAEFTDGFLNALIPDPQGARNTRAANQRSDIKRLFAYRQVGADHPALRGTAYGLLNAVAEYTDYERTTRVASGAQGSKLDARLDSTWFGSGAAFRRKAAELLVEQIDLDEIDVAPAAPTPDRSGRWDAAADAGRSLLDELV